MTPREAVELVESRMGGPCGIVQARIDGAADSGTLELRLSTSLFGCLFGGKTQDMDPMEVDCLMESMADNLERAAQLLRGKEVSPCR